MREEDGRDRRVVELFPLVKRMALEMRRHLPAHIDVDDLVGDGALGLVDAVRKFDPRRQVKLETYARHRIRGAFLDGLRSLDGASRDQRKKNKKAEQTHRELEAKLGRPPSDGEMAQALGLSLKGWYRTAREIEALGVEWLRPMGSAGMKQPGIETLVAGNQENQFDLCYRREQRGILERALACLRERERQVLLLYYDQALTMKQIGAKLGIDESRVSQLHAAALDRLRFRVEATLRRRPPRILPAYGVAGQVTP